MAIKIMEYLPNFLHDVYELKKITDTEDIELNNLHIITDSILDETIVENASKYRNRKIRKNL